MKSVLIIDDHPLLATTVSSTLTQLEVADVTAMAPHEPELIAQLLRTRPDLCLLDLHLDNRTIGGEDLAKTATAAGLRVAMLTGSTDEVALGRCIQAGAVGVVSKRRSFAEVTSAVADLLEGSTCNSDTELLRWVLAAQRDSAERDQAMRPFEALSGREQQVLGHLLDGLRVDQIAAIDFVSTATVRSQVRAVLRKLGVRSQVAAVVRAHRAGWSCPVKAETATKAS